MVVLMMPWHEPGTAYTIVGARQNAPVRAIQLLEARTDEQRYRRPVQVCRGCGGARDGSYPICDACGRRRRDGLAG